MMASEEPGLDRHEWESEYAALEEELKSDPAATLPDFADLVERMLVARGYRIDEPVEEAGDERDVVSEFEAAREVAAAVSLGSDAVGPGDVGSAINGLRAVYEHLIAERSSP